MKDTSTKRGPGRPRKECPAELEPKLGELPAHELAEQVGVTPGVVRRWRQERGIRGPPPARKPPSLPQERIGRFPGFVEHYEAGESFQDLGKRYGVSRQRTHQLAKALGLPSRAGYPAAQLAGRREPAQQRVDERPRKGSGAQQGAVGAPLRGGVSDYGIATQVDANLPGVSVHRSKLGEAAYQMRARTGRSWSEIGRRLGLINACTSAARYAARSGWAWPITNKAESE